MPWWDYREIQSGNQQASQDYFEQAQQLLRKQQEEQQRRAEMEAQKKDAGGILGFMGKAGSKLNDATGGLIGEGAGDLVKGLDWYDKNVVGNVWDNGVGKGVAWTQGKHYDDSWKYDNLSGWQKFSAGVLADPLNWLPAAGAATKGLKAVTANERALRALSGVEKGIDAANAVQDVPFKVAGAGLKYGVGAPVGFAAGKAKDLITATDMGADIFRTLGRPTTSFLVRQDSNLARHSASFLLDNHARSLGLQTSEDLTADEARGFLRNSLTKVRTWDQQIAEATRMGPAGEKTVESLMAAKPTFAERQVADYMGGGPGQRMVTKRLWENFRRIATSKGVNTGSNDLDYVDDVIRGVSDKEIEPKMAATMLAIHAGDDSAAEALLTGKIDPRRQDLMLQWVNNWAGNRERNIADSLLETADNGTQVVNNLAQAVGNQTQKDISSATRAAREFMNDVHFGPVQVNTGGILTQSFDPFYQKWWTKRIEKYMVNPFQQLVLGYAFFPLSNVLEEVAQNMVGGNLSYKNWSMGADEFLGIYSKMGPRFELPPSLLDGLGDKDRFAAQLLGEKALDERELSMLGGSGTHSADRGIKGLVTGGMPLRLSNIWSGNARRAYVMNTFSRYMDGAFPELTDLGKEAAVLRKYGWDKRVGMELKMSMANAAQGASPEEVAMTLHNNWRGPHQDIKKIESVINNMGFHPRTQQFLLNNVQGLSNPETRDKFLNEAFDLYNKDVTLAMENAGGLVDEWSTAALEDLDNATADDLVASLRHAEDARQVMDRIYEHSRTQGEMLSRVDAAAGHKFNAEQLRQLDDRYTAFNERYEAIHQKVSSRLEAAGALTKEGKAAVGKIGKNVGETTSLYKERAKELRAVHQKYAGRKSLNDMTPEQLDAWHEAQDKVYAKYQPQLDKFRDELRAMNGPQANWFPAMKAARDAQEIADHIVRGADIPNEVKEEATTKAAAAIRNGEDPYDVIADYTKFPDFEAVGGKIDKFETPPQGFPGHEYSFPGDSGEQLPLPEGQAGGGTLPVETPDMTPTPPGMEYYDKPLSVESDPAVQGRAREIVKNPRFTGNYADAIEIAKDELIHGKTPYEATARSVDSATDLTRVGEGFGAKPGKPRTGIINTESDMEDQLTKLKHGPVTSRKATDAERREMYKSKKVTWYASTPEEGVESELISKPGEAPLYKMTSRPHSVGGPLPQHADPFVYTREGDTIVKRYKSEMEFEAQGAVGSGAPTHANPATEAEYAQQLYADYLVMDPAKAGKHLEKLSDHDLRLLEDEIDAHQSGAYKPSEPATDPLLKAEENKAAPYAPNTATEPFRGAPSDKPTNRPLPTVEEPYTPPPGSKTLSQDDITVGRGGNVRPKYDTEDGRYFYDENRPEPPSFQSDSDMLQNVHLESQARSMARQAGIPVEEARNKLWEEGQIARMLKDKEQSEEWAQRTGTIFRGVENAPDRTPFYEDAAASFRAFIHQLDTASAVEGRAPELEKALDSILKRYTKNLAAMDKEGTLKTMDQAWQRALEEYHKYFTNYDDGKTVHLMMRHLFPFWRYEYQRYPRLARTFRKAPFLLTNYHRFMEGNGDGTVNIPGTGLRLNPVGGTMYTAMRDILKDGGYSYNGRGGFWQRANEVMKVTGFMPGPVVSVPDAIASGTPGDQVPTAIKAPMDIARGYGPMVPVVGETVSDTAAAVEDRLDSRFRQYNVNQVLAEKGIHPYEATPEQRREAAQEVARSSALSMTTGYVLQNGSQWTRDQSEAQLKAAREAGIPEEALKEARRQHGNALYSTDDQGKMYLNVAARREIEQQHPEWERLAAVRSAFKDPSQLRDAQEKYTSQKTVDQMQADAEDKLKPVYQAFARGEITGRQLLDQRKTVMDELRGAKQAHNAKFANPKKESDQSRTPREDILAATFYDIEPPTLSTGLPDWDSADRLKAQFLRDNNVTPDEMKYITEVYPRKKFQDPMMNAIEGDYKQASNLRRDYYSIPQYKGLDQSQADMANKGMDLIAQIRKGRPNLTTAQALSLLARYDPAVAQATRKALTIKKRQDKTGSDRKKFWDQNPLLDQFYGS